MNTEASPQEHGLIARLIALCADKPGLVLLLLAGLAALGWRALERTPLDAIPDLSDVQVIVHTTWDGRSPDLVEDQVTWPLSAALLSTAHVTVVRGLSDFGSSYVYVLFEDGTDLYEARSRVLETLQTVSDQLPEGARPSLGPDASGVGWVFQYALVDRTGKHDLQQLRAIQDWRLRYALASVPGVAEVASLGGAVKQLQVDVDPNRMRALNLSLMDLSAAVKAASQDAGGEVLEIAGHEHMVRSRGYVQDLAALAAAPVGLGPDGVPITVGDLGVVTEGPAPQRGIAELDGQGEVAGAVVLMRMGGNALDVIDAVKARLTELSASLPPGVEVVITYDRSALIRAAIDTLRRTLLEEMIVVSAVIFLFLLHARSALVPVITLPLAVLLSFIPMAAQHLTANLMSLGGIAVAIGAMVDASVILIENIHKHLEHWEERGRPGERRAVVIAAMQEVGPSVFFSLLVLTVAFVPVFSLTGAEGRLFRPLAFSKTWSMAWASVLAVTATPALAVLLIRGKIRPESAHPLHQLLLRFYAPIVRFVVRHRVAVPLLAAAVTLASLPLLFTLDREFMPPLQEGTILYMPTAPPGMSVTEASRVLQHMDRVIKEVPEVAHVFGKMGRAETATDPAPLGMAEVTVTLKPTAQWRPGLDWDGLLAELDAALQIPGMPNLFWMPIQTRTEMLSTGVRSPLGVQIFGADLAEIEAAAVKIEAAVAALPGVRSATAERSAGGFYLDVDVKREAAARLGLSVADVQEVVRLAIGGMPVAETIQGRERYDIRIRYQRELRDDPEALGRVRVDLPAGGSVPLSQVAELRFSMGPPMIRSEGGELVGYVFVDPGDRALGSLVTDTEAAVRALGLPPGVRTALTGQFKHYERAWQTLKLMLPITLFAVFILIYLNTGSAVETAMIVLAVPFSAVGAAWLLWALDYRLSVAVWVGVIALIGLDAETGVVMLLYLKISWRRWREAGRIHRFEDLTEAIVEGAAGRVRPKLMTVLTTFIGLVPILWSTGTGAELMRRVAAPMVGGLGTSFLLELTVYPALFALWKGAELRREAAGRASG